MNVNSKDLLDRFGKLKVWRRNDERAPHKPLLALWAIGRCLNGEERMVSYEDTRKELAVLLRRFGPHRKTVHPEFPFWHLQNDHVWIVQGDGDVPISVGPSGHALVSSLKQQNACGGFPPEIFRRFQEDRTLAVNVAYSLVEAHFPETYHDDIFEAVNIHEAQEDETDIDYVYARRRLRDSSFSRMVLAAYDHQCAVCDFSVRLGNHLVALEAAHIKWHCARGPDQVHNALSLCALHHRLFDAGAFTLSLDQRVVVANSVRGEGVHDALGRFDRKLIQMPIRDDDLPEPIFLKWHHKEVFKSQIGMIGNP